MKKAMDFLKKQPMLSGVIALALSVLAIKIIPQGSFGVKCLLRILMCGTMLVFLYLISGEKTPSMSDNRTGYVIKAGLGLWIVAAIMGLMAFIPQLFADGGLPEGWLKRLIVLFFMFLFGCLFEELCFRAVLNDAIVYQFRNSKHVFLVSAVVTSLVFGLVHVMGSSLTSALEWAQAGMKTLQTAIIGFAFLILYWKTRNIWACGIVHGIFDFLTELSLAFSESAKIGAGTYVQGGNDGKAAVGFYAVTILFNLVITLRIWHKVGKTIDFEQMRRTW